MESKPEVYAIHDSTVQDDESDEKQAIFDQDQRDMQRMGKTQELRRNFNMFSILGFLSVVQIMWESTLLASDLGLWNGGTAGVIWMTIVCWLCFLCLMASMAEMASMAPTAGGQYHWVSEFAPPAWQQPMSYIIGWSSTLGWIAGVPSCAQICAALIQGMVVLVHPDANVTQLWQTGLIIFAFLLLTFWFLLYVPEWLPLAEGYMLVFHLVGWLVILVVLWSCGNHAPAKQVFTQFNDGGGWGNVGLSTLVGISSPIWFFIGPDAGAHMSEELKDASLTLPRAMFWSTFMNGILGIIMLITFCFCITDLNAVLDTSTGQPVIQVVYNLTNSYAAACIIGTMLLLLQLAGTITSTAASCRQCWAFARDRGFPLSTWIMKVDPKRKIPVNATYITAAVSFALATINFGSFVAFDAVVTISNAALTFSYLISVGSIRLKRLRGEPLLPRRWSLGRYGGLVNDITIAFLLLSFVLSFFPANPLVGDPTWAADMNWAIVVFAAVCALAGAYYMAGGKDLYVPPVKLVKHEL